MKKDSKNTDKLKKDIKQILDETEEEGGKLLQDFKNSLQKHQDELIKELSKSSEKEE